MKTTATVLLMLPLLAGCVSSRVQEAREQMQRDMAACREAPKTTRVALARCINAAEEPAMRVSGASSDLVAVRLATRTAIAEKMDKGQMTEAEGELEFAKVNAGLTSTDQQRVNAAVTANAMATMAAPRSTTCTRIGNTVNCF